MLGGGVWHGKRIVPADFLHDMMTIQRKPNQAQDHGYLIWRRDYTTACGVFSGWYMAGNGGNAIVLFADLDTAVVVARTRHNTRGMHQETTRLLEEYVVPALAC